MATDTLVVGPYAYAPLKVRQLQLNPRSLVLQNILLLRQLPDEQLLSFLSTSPEAEGPNFLPDLRACLDFMYEHSDPDEYWKGRGHRYRRGPNGAWIAVPS